MSHSKGTEIQIGKTYHQNTSDLRILALHDGTALIEYGSNGIVIQYIVTTGLYIEEGGDLHWTGNGSYFLFGHGDDKTANDALTEAWSYYRREDHVYLLTADTTEGTWAAVFQTRELALAALQTFLDKNEIMQEVATENGLLPLTAARYLETQYVFTERTEDYYAVDGMPVLRSVPKEGVGGNQCTPIGL